jgi:hypothetical protein
MTGGLEVMPAGTLNGNEKRSWKNATHCPRIKSEINEC